MGSESKSRESALSGSWEVIKIVLQAFVLALIIRNFFYQPFNIPSGSMKSTLLVGDYLFVSKLSYGYSRYSFPFGLNLFSGRVFAGEPKRGDIIVFKQPLDNSTDYIKRLIGLPGDTIQMRAGVLYINGKAVPKRRVADFVYRNRFGSVIRVPRYEETLPEGRKYFVLDEDPNGDLDSTIEFKVPPGKYFMMGDNRDDSQDSRKMDVVGFVPYENLVGRAEIIFFSADESSSLLEPWRWPFTIRWGRIFQMVR
ncbi:MAG: signal peptidase I [Hyphomicrobiaceae bacterium]|nr:signal peptidase I [Hyphomicrobiaceae bacterium]